MEGEKELAMRRSTASGSTFVFLFLLVVSTVSFAAATEVSETITLELPAGDPLAGRATFQALSCTSCHRVTGEKDFAAPVSANPGPTLGGYLGREGAQSVATSIFVPSHDIRGALRPGREDKLSPMGDFTETMTVRQLIDVVTYLRTEGGSTVARGPRDIAPARSPPL